MLIWKWLSEILKRWDLVLVLSLHHPPQNLTAPSCPTGQYHQVGNGFTKKISQGNIYKWVLHKNVLRGQYHSTQYVLITYVLLAHSFTGQYQQVLRKELQWKILPWQLIPAKYYTKNLFHRAMSPSKNLQKFLSYRAISPSKQ